MSQQDSVNEDKGRVVFLDGIRGWASVMVMLGHLVLWFLGNNVPGMKGWFFGFATDGNLAIFIFFVLSGFALSTGYVQTGKMSVITSQALRRHLRLGIPILFSSLLAYALMKLGWFYNGVAGVVAQNGWMAKFYAFEPSLFDTVKFSLYDVFVHYDARVSLNAPLWTMSIEFWGSLIVFSICAMVMRLRSRLFILVAIIAYLCINKSLWYVPFVCGMVITVVYHQYGFALRRGFRFLGPLLIGLLVYYSASTLRGGMFGLPAMIRSDTMNILVACGLVLAAACTAQIKWFFENALSRYLGSISFSLYLTHFIVMCSFSSYLLVKLHTMGLSRETSSTINFVASLIVCFVVAHLFRYVEDFAISCSRCFAEFLMGRLPRKWPVEKATPPATTEPGKAAA